MTGRALSAVFLVILSLGPACADAFDDFNQGVAANDHEDSDAAIAALSRAISATDLSPSLKPVALSARGLAYSKKKQYAEAISDFTAAIKLKSDDTDAYRRRANAYHDSGDDASAAKDCDVLAHTSLRSAYDIRWCGRLRWEVGDFSNAYLDFKGAAELDPTDAYGLLWLELTRTRAGAPDDHVFEQNAESLSNRGWPLPLINLYRGRGSLSDAAADVTARDEQLKRDQTCELGFYGGEWQFLHGNIAAARPLLEQAAQLCPDSYQEVSPAKTELKRLNMGAKS
jgi:tetratricopeptide (TPR) repeat protein